jgi:hypothetical protein
MPTEDTPTSSSGLDVTKLLSELEVPFSPDQVRWRVTNTTNDKRRGQIVPYADCRAYTDRLNALFTPQGWTRDYKVETMTNITRVKKGESIVSGKVLVTCTVTILGIGSHSGTGEEWADDDNGMTSADAQAFKRACSCFGLGRYFYDLQAVWVDLDQNRQPVRTPALFAWALPDNWRKGMRPSTRRTGRTWLIAPGVKNSAPITAPSPIGPKSLDWGHRQSRKGRKGRNAGALSNVKRIACSYKGGGHIRHVPAFSAVEGFWARLG